MTLRNRHRWRVGLTIAIAGLFVVGIASCFFGVFAYHGDGAYRERGYSLVQATLSANYADRSASASLMSRRPQSGWRIETNPASGSPFINWRVLAVSQNAPFPSWAVRLPLWIPFLVLGVPCGWLWWRHLTRPAHACEECGYGLRGLASGKCPECGRTQTA